MLVRNMAFKYAFVYGLILRLISGSDLVIRRETGKIICSVVFEIPLPDWHVCMEICSRLSVCKSVNYKASVKRCQINDAVPNANNTLVTGSSDDNFIMSSDIPSNVAGSCQNHDCTVAEICKEVHNGYECLSLQDTSVEHVVCETDWVSMKGHCYYFGSDMVSWSQAQGDCQSRGSNLVKIENECEQQWLFENFPDDFAWIGANRLNTDGVWKWVSDNTTVDGQYSAWDPREPNNHGGIEDCASAWKPIYSFLWNDAPCESYNLGYICKI